MPREPILKMVSTEKGSVKLTIVFVVSTVNRFCCYKSKEISNSFLTVLLKFWVYSEYVLSL